RFNWNTPILLSPHDPKTVYFGGQFLFKSLSRGDAWDTISADLTRGLPEGWTDTGHTITTIAESPLKAGILWVGTDDGRLHLTKDGGKEWIELTAKIPALNIRPGEKKGGGDAWITRVECSHFNE